jgi:hypothetical protein
MTAFFDGIASWLRKHLTLLGIDRTAPRFLFPLLGFRFVTLMTSALLILSGIVILLEVTFDRYSPARRDEIGEFVIPCGARFLANCTANDMAELRRHQDNEKEIPR